MGAKIMLLQATELAYIAGFIDGEGWLGCRKVGQQLQARMAVANTDARVLLWIKRKLGVGCIYKSSQKSGYKPLYTYELSGKGLKEFLPQLLPFFIVKLEQAILLTEFLKTVTRTGRKGLTQEVMGLRENIKRQLTLEKQKEYSLAA